MSKCKIYIAECQVQSISNREKRDDRGKLQSVTTYASLAWLGGSMNIELDSAVIGIPENVALNVIIEADLTNATMGRGDNEWSKLVANPRRLVKYDPSVPVPLSSLQQGGLNMGSTLKGEKSK